jgi:uncharacterized protein (DUF1778 family)
VATKEARLEIRLTREQKSLLVRAAALREASVADFVRRAAQEVAAQVVTEHEVVRLCAQDQEAFAAALLAPREPSKTFEAALADYQQRVGT